jgi:Nitrile hydratase, alpha chain
MKMPENEPEFGKIVAKAWRDPAFKAELIANPAAALKAEGIDVPAGMTVTVVENTDKQFHLVLPPVPTDELSDEALDAVAGGVNFFCFVPRNFGRGSPLIGRQR